MLWICKYIVFFLVYIREEYIIKGVREFFRLEGVENEGQKKDN